MIRPEKVCKKNKKKDMEQLHQISDEIFSEAEYYYEATMILEKAREPEQLFPPVIMNATFACELFSKSILYKEQKERVIKEHSLEKLYNQFSDSVKIQIKESFQYMDENRMITFIGDIGELFEFWRYRYEYDGYSTHYSFVFEYMEALKKVSEKIMVDKLKQVDYVLD